MNQIEEFVREGKRQRKWIHIPRYHLNVYFRVTSRYLDGKLVDTLDIATIEVDFRHQCQGNFTRFIAEVETIAAKYNRYVYVESILRGFLFDSLLKRGYKKMTPDERSLAKSFMVDTLEVE